MRAKRNKSSWIKAQDLVIHPLAQRRLSPAKLSKIRKTLDLDAIGTVHVANYEGINWVIDGQHRVTALIQEDMGDWPVHCELHLDVDSHARAAELFLKLNDRAVVGAYDKFANKVTAGEDVAVTAKKTVESFGLHVDRQYGDGNITAVAVIEKLQDKGILGDTLKTAVDAWGLRATAVEGKLLEGIGMLHERFNGELDRDALAKKLAKNSPAAILGDGKAIARMRRCSVREGVADCIVHIYNTRRSADTQIAL